MRSGAGRLAKRAAGRLLGSAAAGPVLPRFPRAVAAAPGSLVTLGRRALEQVDGVAAPIVLAYHPVVRGNPFQSMLYGSCAERGIGVVPLGALGALDDARVLGERGARVWLHLHWTQTVLAGARTPADARARREAFERRLDAFRRDGGKIAWTVHNVLPHEHRFGEEEAAVCRAIADRADLVHVLCRATASATAPHYALPAERVRVVEHPSYVGVYPDYVSAAQARADLGFAPEHTVLGFVGAIRPYKGVGRLLDAFDRVWGGDGTHRLVIAGQPGRFPGMRSLRARAARHPGVVARFERIHDQDVQRYVKACDAVVLPYEDILNSGVAMLAFSFGRPVIAPARGCVGEVVTAEVGVTFDPRATDGLESALRSAASLKDPRFGAAARTIAERFPPAAVSRAFCAALRDADGQAG